uniref:Uncharacterized protein n=2 Tax=Kalmanozyma brasiliensis (strain GHG001) TaxID=1365824 RepID=V5EJH9_KALBG
MLRGHAPYKPRPAQNAAVPSRAPTASSASSSATKARAPTHAQIAIHPITGVPMLFVEEDADAEEVSHGGEAAMNEYDESEDEADEWPIDDESDLDWLGQEILRRHGGADVWVLGTDNDVKAHKQASTSPVAGESLSPSKSGAAAATAKQAETIPVHLPTAVEEVDSNHELANIGSSLSSRSEAASNPSSPSQRVAAALARAALRSPSGGSEKQTSNTTGKARRPRSATVMSESEEEVLETVGRPVEEDEKDESMDDAGSLNDRPRKSIKVVDVRTKG